MSGIKIQKGDEILRPWLKLILGALFTKVIYTFLKPVRKDGFFDAPFDLFKEKKFSSLRRDNELF
jgi:hypothetical protein